jgi:hypothetical protein
MKNINSVTKLKGYKPIAFKNKSTIIVANKNKLFYYDLGNNRIKYFASINWSLKSKIFSVFAFIYRITRGGIRNGIIFDDYLYCTFEGKIWSLSLSQEGEVQPKLVFSFLQGSNSLHFSLVDKSDSIKTGFEEGIYFGEYFSNPEKKPVNIFHIDKKQSVNCVYTFSKGEINHVHNVVFDIYRRCAWVLAGDFGKSAGMWQFGENFKNLLSVINGDQMYRSCVGFAVSEGLLYATDSQFEPNSIRLLTIDGSAVSSQHICSINGPCIHGSSIGQDFIFTTATEPNITSESLTVRDLFSRSLGSGILENRSFVYRITSNFNVTELFSLSKDIWPYYFAQFGNIVLPEGKNNSDFLVTYSIANKNNDHCMEIRSVKGFRSKLD